VTVLFTERSGRCNTIGLITLNRPAVLNALNREMVIAIRTQLQAWSKAAHIRAVVIRAEGRAFCAGGDLLALQRSSATSFFREEYQLNHDIFHYPKPYIALLDGITMGGGVGISVYGSHCVATENLVFAMPETRIGFFPDVGSSYWLSRLPQQMGRYIGLTGARLTADDCVALGIIHCKVQRGSLEALIDAFIDAPPLDRRVISQIIDQFKVSIKTTTWQKDIEEIEPCFAVRTIEEICQECIRKGSPLSQKILADVLAGSPTSLKVTLRALARGRVMDFDACLHQDYGLCQRFLQGHDFFEGIRAVLIEKNHTPFWQPSRLELVTEEVVEQYFLPLENDDRIVI
jgi:enoyl-CoA hydratase